MVDVVGHLGMALIWLAPAWLAIDRVKTVTTFVGVGFWFGLLPDSDLYIRRVLKTVKHHGVLHTVLGVTIIAAVLGPLIAWLLERMLAGTEWFSRTAERYTFAFGFLMVWVSGLSHIFADMLSAPDIAEPLEPLWPLYQQSFGIDVVWYSDPWVNRGLLIVGLVLNMGMYYWKRNASERLSAQP